MGGAAKKSKIKNQKSTSANPCSNPTLNPILTLSLTLNLILTLAHVKRVPIFMTHVPIFVKVGMKMYLSK
jgi:hypothetical protein